MVKQAQSQIDAAKGMNIVWRVALREKAAKVQRILGEKRLYGIAVDFPGQ